MRINRSNRRAVTLVELVVVMAILVALAGLVIPQFVSTTEDARGTAGRSSLVEVRDAVLQFWNDCKYDPILSANPRIQIVDLIDPRSSNLEVFNPNVPDSTLGWNGPYLEQSGRYTVKGSTAVDYTAAYGTDDDPAVLDPWLRPFVIQEAAPVGNSRQLRIVSAGPDGVFDILESTSSQELMSGAVASGDDLYVAFTLR